MAARITIKFVIVTLLVSSTQGSHRYTSFSYGVADPNTGDFKDQQERREGGNVVGKYSLIDADGTKRIVEYTADSTGFKAVVLKEPTGIVPLSIGAFGYGGPNHVGLTSENFGHPGGPEGAAPLPQHLPASAVGPYSRDDHHPAAGHLPQGVNNGLPFANAQGNPVLVHGLPGYGHGSPLVGSLPGNYPGAYPRRPPPAISHYSHTIVHDVRPYGGPYAASGPGQYGRYGAQAPLSHNAGIGHHALPQGLPSPQGFASPQAHGPLPQHLPQQGLITHPAHGHFGLPTHGDFSALHHNNGGPAPSTIQGGWSSPLANGGLAALLPQQGPAPHPQGFVGLTLAHGGFPSPLGYGLFPTQLVHGGIPRPPPQGLLPHPPTHGGLPSPLPQGGLDSALTHNETRYPLGPGQLPQNDPQSPFFNGPLAHGSLPQSALARNPASLEAPPPQRGLPSPPGPNDPSE